MAFIRVNKATDLNIGSATVVTNDTKLENLTVGKSYTVGGAWDATTPSVTSGASDVNVSQTVSLGSGYYSGVMTLKATATTVNFGGHFFGAYCQLD